VDFAGRRIIACDAPLEFVEVTESTGTAELNASDLQRVHLESELRYVESKLTENDPKRMSV
jgi:hypothetical protein